jgi:hypothetical protein
MSVKGGPNTVTSGLVLELDAGNIKSYQSGSTTWYDKSGNGNNATLVNGPTFDTGSLGSIKFDGTNDYVATNTSGMAEGTMLCFFNPSASVNLQYFEGLIDNDVPGQYGQGMGINNGVFETILDNEFWTPNVTVDIGSWQMCALSWNATTANFYKNGVLRNTLSYTRGSVTTATYYIGASHANPRFLNGRIATAQIYNRALSASEVLQNYNATKGRFGL